ncbi:translocation/assembly module TamB domain-containing protein [Geitlerinema sp. PCC 9228]|uniref:translocation/assembly module TamB domain-containing protein n=1 Tax=Geitlerinema sp. PCC 9228 TaxID=111611 RepID=UPI0008F9848A|nr:translocation/assembly module TamB domain-containing protein [Geitlerinema sp. PCC 9228]
MTNSPSPERKSTWLIWVRRTGLVAGVAVFSAAIGGTWWVKTQLAPLVSNNLSNIVQRPVNLGSLQQFSLTQLTFGETTVPATDTDSDRASVESVVVNFNLWQVITNRTLPLDITLVNPQAYIEQQQPGKWLQLNLQLEKPGPIQPQLQAIAAKNARLTLDPYGSEAVDFHKIQLVTQFANNNQKIQFQVSGAPISGGNFAATGEFRQSPNTAPQLEGNLQSQNLQLPPITNLLPSSLLQDRLQVVSGTLQTNIDIAWNFENALPDLQGTAKLQATTLDIQNVPQLVTLKQADLSLQQQQVRIERATLNYSNIPVEASGTVDLAQERYDLQANMASLPLSRVLSAAQVSLPIAIATQVAAAVRVTGPLTNPIVRGQVRTTQTTQIYASNNPQPNATPLIDLDRASSNFQIDQTQLQLLNLSASPRIGGEIFGGGRIDFSDRIALNLDLALQNLPLEPFLIRGLQEGSLPFRLGRLNATTQIRGWATNPQVQTQWRLRRSSIEGSGELTYANQRLDIRNTKFQLAGGSIDLNSKITLNDPTANAIQASVSIANIQLEKLGIPQAAGFSGQFQLASPLTPQGASDLQASGSAKVQLSPQETVAVENFTLESGNFAATVASRKLTLKTINPNLQGTLTSSLDVAGSLSNLSANGIQANGQLQFSRVPIATSFLDSFNIPNFRPQALEPIFASPTNVSLRWDGQTLQLPSIASEAGIRANGSLDVALADLPQITGYDLNVDVQEYPLAKLPLAFPDIQIADRIRQDLQGNATFSGRLVSDRLQGIPEITGDLTLNQFGAYRLAFERRLTGPISVTPEGIQVALSGESDAIQVALNQKYLPTRINIQQEKLDITGQCMPPPAEKPSPSQQVDASDAPISENCPWFQLQVQEFPLAGWSDRVLGGTLFADLNIDWQQLQVAGSLTVNQPAIASPLGRIEAQTFASQFRYSGNTISVTDTKLVQGNSQYAFSGGVILGKNPRFRGDLEVVEGYLQDVLVALQWFDINDIARGLTPPQYGTAKDVVPTPVGMPDAPLLTQLRRFSEIQHSLKQRQQARREASLLPPLSTLQGQFNGNIEVEGSLQRGLVADFNVQGQDWSWGGYQLDTFLLQGNFENGKLTLLPLRLERKDILLAFKGNVGGEEQSAQLNIQEFPVGILENFLDLPVVDVSGQLNAKVSVAGSFDNPQAKGEITLAQGQVNLTDIQDGFASFNYSDGRLQFGSEVLVSPPEPIRIRGDIPIQLPFAEVSPSPDLEMTVVAQDEAMQALNLLTNQVKLQAGTGQVRLNVSGTLQDPAATGTIQMNESVFTTPLLPEPLTDVSVAADFAGDRVSVEQITGKYSQGNVRASGVLPLFRPLSSNDEDRQNPLQVTLEQIRTNLRGIYIGGVDGNLTIRGHAFNPEIGGRITLSNGKVILDPNAAAMQTPTTELSADSQETFVTEFDNLILTLGKNLRITSPAVLNFVATGDLRVGGTLDTLRPAGTVELKSGQVNLFTTVFNLRRGYKHTARFVPSQGLDPNLDLRLLASVPEFNRRASITTSEAEISDPSLAPNLGELRTIRVQAIIEGRSSELFNNLKLTSSPPRSESEILALIGGGFVDTFGRGESWLAIANLAGSALLTNVDTFIANTLGLSDFRLFPVTIPDEESGSSSLALGIEAGVNLPADLSFSIRKLVPSEDPLKYNLRYRVNENILLRGSTDLSGESQATVEFELRF